MTGTLDGLRVLVVEDEPLQALNYYDILTDAGAEVLGPYASSSSAIAVAAKLSCDVAVVDYALDDETSVSLQERLETLDIPFIVLTAYPKVLVRRYTLQTVIAKPVSPELLCRMVKVSAKQPARPH